MKKMILLGLSLLVVAVFLVSCAPAEDKEAVGDLTAAELSEVEPKSSAIAGKAIDFSNCVDPDSTTTFDKNSLTTKSTTTYAGGSFEDKCYTWNKGTPQEKTRLIEGTCKSGKFLNWYATCADYLGKNYKCADGACVKTEACGNVALEPYCDGISKVTMTQDTCSGKVTVSFTNCDEKCNPGKTSNCGGGGYQKIIGSGCDGMNLIVNNNKKYDCSKEKGFLSLKTCGPFKPMLVTDEKLLTFGEFICIEACTPGQIITWCDDNDFFQDVCNSNGFGWNIMDIVVSGCPDGKTCKEESEGFGVCK